MLKDNKILIGKNDEKELYIVPEMANRHGLITGASGTGKTITLKVMAESFSDAGVPVFVADVKGAVVLPYELPALVHCRGVAGHHVDDLPLFSVAVLVFQIKAAVPAPLGVRVIIMLVEIDIIAVFIGLLKVKLRGFPLIVQVNAVLFAAAVLIDGKRLMGPRRPDAHLGAVERCSIHQTAFI